VPRYALLQRASANRVYGATALQLARAELDVVGRVLARPLVTSCEPHTIGGVEYLVLECSRALAATDLAVLSNLSSLHALFEIDDDRFRPLPVVPHACQDDDITTIQRYAGKTNEAFTHLLVNLALAAADGAFARLLAGDAVRLLDPACGRGTTLNRAIVYGMDAVGVEVDQRDTEAYETFLLTWLKDKRLKHEVSRERHRRGRPAPAHRLTVSYGTKDRATRRTVDLIHDDTVRAHDHLPERSVDVLACDLPYGVQHAARSTGEPLRRGPGQLLDAALPVWRDLLRPGAGIALAWNRRTLPRDEVVGLLDAHGLAVDRATEPDAFVHRVDRSITRDVVVATRPA